MLAFMREEEKLAHDVYLLFSEMYAGQEAARRYLRASPNPSSGTRTRCKGLLDEYGLPDPAAGLAPGEFANRRCRISTRRSSSVGASGYTEALGVGVVIEQKDMTDIVAAIELSVAYADIVQVYSNLLTGSEHHLAAFLKVLDSPSPVLRT